MALAAILAGGALLGCFSPRQPGCAFSCAADGVCPAEYSCDTDGLCHRDDGKGTCDLPPQTDGAVEASDGTPDAAADRPDATD
jgi:hypothetical protein